MREDAEYEMLRRAAHDALREAVLRAFDFKGYCDETERLAKSKARVAFSMAGLACRLIEELEGLGSIPSVETMTQETKR